MPSKREGVESDDEANKAPPLTVEEAKSGRSTCKSSGEKIEKGEMRVGIEAFMGGRMTMAWQKLVGFFDNCRIEHCLRKASGKCRATGYTFQQGDVRFVATLGKERPSKMFLTMDAAHEALIPAVEALEGAPWDPLTLQGLCDLKPASRQHYFSLNNVPATKAAAFNKDHPPPAEDAVLKPPPRKRKSVDNTNTAARTAIEDKIPKATKRRKQQTSYSDTHLSEDSSEADEEEDEMTLTEVAAQADASGDEQDSDSETEANSAEKPAEKLVKLRAASPMAEVNEYEQQRLDNIARNMARMKELNLMGAVAAVTPASKPKPAPMKGLQPRKRNKEPPGPRRSSLRIAHIAADGNQIDHEGRNGALVVVNGEAIRYGVPRSIDGPGNGEPQERHPKGDVPFESSRTGRNADERFIRLLAMETAFDQEANQSAQRQGHQSAATSSPADFTLAENDIAKVIQNGVTHLAWHPRADTAVLAAGDKAGNVSLWQVDHESFSGPAADGAQPKGSAKPAGNESGNGRRRSLRSGGPHTTAGAASEGGAVESTDAQPQEDSQNEDRVDDGIVTNIRPHHAYISGLRWIEGRGSAMRLLTTSYDGSLRCMDPGAACTFSLLHSDEDAEYSAMEATPDSASVWLGDNSGTVEAVDLRAPQGKPAQEVPICSRKINTLSLEPLEGRVLAVAGGDGSLTLWDIRKLDAKAEAVAAVKHSKTCLSAYFAPDGSQRVLSTSRDDTLRVWRGREGLSEAVSVAHNNNTGRYITPFRAIWEPSSASFICGNMKRLVNVYDSEGNESGQLSSDLMTAIPSRFACHSQLPLMAAATASGRIHVFR